MYVLGLQCSYLAYCLVQKACILFLDRGKNPGILAAIPGHENSLRSIEMNESYKLRWVRGKHTVGA